MGQSWMEGGDGVGRRGVLWLQAFGRIHYLLFIVLTFILADRILELLELSSKAISVF